MDKTNLRSTIRGTILSLNGSEVDVLPLLQQLNIHSFEQAEKELLLKIYTSNGITFIKDIKKCWDWEHESGARLRKEFYEKSQDDSILNPVEKTIISLKEEAARQEAYEYWFNEPDCEPWEILEFFDKPKIWRDAQREQWKIDALSMETPKGFKEWIKKSNGNKN